jgi:hypothetical protein
MKKKNNKHTKSEWKPFKAITEKEFNKLYLTNAFFREIVKQNMKFVTLPIE